MNEKVFEGAVFSVPMFFEASGKIDFRSLQSYLELCCEQKSIRVLYSMAYNTRYMQLSYNEILQVNKLVCEIASGAGKLSIVGHPLNLTSNELTDYVEAVSSFNPYAFSILYPERYFSNNEAIVDYLNIPQKFSQNLVIHEMQLISGFNGQLINWPTDLLEQAMRLPNCVGIKEDSKDDSITELAIDIASETKTNIILAGGGKRRAIRFLETRGLKTWLNGSLMLDPKKADKVNSIFLSNDKELIGKYITNIEEPYFDEFIANVGWHVGHKFALSRAGYCENKERAPMPTLSTKNISEYACLVDDVIKQLERF